MIKISVIQMKCIAKKKFDKNLSKQFVIFTVFEIYSKV